MSLKTKKEDKLARLKQLMNPMLDRQPIDTGLGYSVDGSKDDLFNYLMAKQISSPVVRDSNNVMQSVTIQDWDAIISAVAVQSSSAFAIKWEYSERINACKTVAVVDAIDIDIGFGAEPEPTIP